MRKMRLLIAVVLIITGVVGTFYSWKNLKDNPAANGEKAFPADHIDRLTIDSDSANLTILPGEGNDIQVEWSSNQKEFLHYEAEGNTLKIRMGRKHTFFPFRVDFGFGSWSKNKVIVYLPKKLIDLHVKNAVGKTSVSSIHTENMTIVADAASVDLKNLDTKSVEVETDVGSISLDHVQGNVQATSDVGGISGEMDIIDDDWTLTSNVGKIALRVGAVNHTSFIANTDVGSVRIFGDNKSYVNKNQKTVVEMKTDVGSINVKRKD